MAAKTYSPELINSLRVALGAEGRLSKLAIAEDHGITHMTLNRLIDEHDIFVASSAVSLVPEDKIEAIRDVLGQPGHASISDYARKMGVSAWVLRNALAEADVYVHPMSALRSNANPLTEDQIAEIREIMGQPGHPSVRAMADRYGVPHGTLAGMIFRRKIFVHPITEKAPAYTWRPAPPPKPAPAPAAAPSTVVRYSSPMARKPKPSSRLFGPLGKPKALKPTDRAEMDRLIAEAVAAGRVTRCPPAHARGSLPDAWFEVLGKAS